MCMSFTVLYKGINQFSVFQKIKLRIDKTDYHIDAINRRGHLLNFWTLRKGTYSRRGAY